MCLTACVYGPLYNAGAAESSGYGGGESEDMLQMALRMATSMPGAPGAMDLESQLQATPVNPSAFLLL